jgi:hypothetical protein
LQAANVPLAAAAAARDEFLRKSLLCSFFISYALCYFFVVY